MGLRTFSTAVHEPPSTGASAGRCPRIGVRMARGCGTARDRGVMTDASWLAGARNLLAALVDLALPAVCAVCGVPVSGAALCELCLSGLMCRAARVRPDPCPPGL